SQGATPPALEDCIREIEHLDIEIAAVEREQVVGADHSARLDDLKQRKEAAENQRDTLKARLEQERKLAEQLQKLQETLEKARDPNTKEKPKLAGNEQEELTKARAELAKLQGEHPLVYPVVDGGVVGEIVAGWTGIPIGKMVRNEIDTVLALHDRLA